MFPSPRDPAKAGFTRDIKENIRRFKLIHDAYAAGGETPLFSTEGDKVKVWNHEYCYTYTVLPLHRSLVPWSSSKDDAQFSSIDCIVDGKEALRSRSLNYAFAAVSFTQQTARFFLAAPNFIYPSIAKPVPIKKSVVVAADILAPVPLPMAEEPIGAVVSSITTGANLAPESLGEIEALVGVPAIVNSTHEGHLLFDIQSSTPVGHVQVNQVDWASGGGCCGAPRGIFSAVSLDICECQTEEYCHTAYAAKGDIILFRDPSGSFVPAAVHVPSDRGYHLDNIYEELVIYRAGICIGSHKGFGTSPLPLSPPRCPRHYMAYLGISSQEDVPDIGVLDRSVAQFLPDLIQVLKYVSDPLLTFQRGIPLFHGPLTFAASEAMEGMLVAFTTDFASPHAYRIIGDHGDVGVGVFPIGALNLRTGTPTHNVTQHQSFSDLIDTGLTSSYKKASPYYIGYISCRKALSPVSGGELLAVREVWPFDKAHNPDVGRGHVTEETISTGRLLGSFSPRVLTTADLWMASQRVLAYPILFPMRGHRPISHNFSRWMNYMGNPTSLSANMECISVGRVALPPLAPLLYPHWASRLSYALEVEGNKRNEDYSEYAKCVNIYSELGVVTMEFVEEAYDEIWEPFSLSCDDPDAVECFVAELVENFKVLTPSGGFDRYYIRRRDPDDPAPRSFYRALYLKRKRVPN